MVRTNYDYFRKSDGWTKADPLKLDSSGRFTQAHVIVMFETVDEDPFDYFAADGSVATTVNFTFQAVVPETGEAVKSYISTPAYTSAWNGASTEPINPDYSKMLSVSYGIALNWPEVSLWTEPGYIDPQNTPADLQVSVWVIYS